MSDGRRSDRLSQLTEVLRAFVEGTSDYGSLLQTVVERASLMLGAYCGVGLRSEDGPWIDLVATHDPDPAALVEVRRLWRGGRVLLDARHPVVEAFRTALTVHLRDFDTESFLAAVPPESHDVLRSVAIRSVLYAPLRARGRVIGVVAVVRHGPGAGPLDDDDALVAESLADHAALAIEHARLVASERAARAAAERESAERERLAETSEGMLATIRDVTEDNQRTREASRLKSEFLANMSHELRTPLNAIIGFAALMHGGRVGPVSEDHREYLGDILTSARHLLQLINDVLDLSKVEAGRVELRVEPVDLARTVGEVRDILRGLAAEKRIRLSVALDPAVATVSVDPRLLKQVLYNLLSNAIKFTPEGGRVALRVAPEGDRNFRLDVEDSGIGVRPEDLSRLFVEFQQLDAGAAKRYPGTGLGLALTRKIVEAQGGRVGVRSKHGEGSTFSAVLPREVAATRSGA